MADSSPEHGLPTGLKFNGFGMPKKQVQAVHMKDVLRARKKLPTSNASTVNLETDPLRDDFDDEIRFTCNRPKRKRDPGDMKTAFALAGSPKRPASKKIITDKLVSPDGVYVKPFASKPDLNKPLPAAPVSPTPVLSETAIVPETAVALDMPSREILIPKIYKKKINFAEYNAKKRAEREAVPTSKKIFAVPSLFIFQSKSNSPKLAVPQILVNDERLDVPETGDEKAHWKAAKETGESDGFDIGEY